MIYTLPCTHRRGPRYFMAVLAIAWSCQTFSSDCKQTSIGLIPINELATDLYLGQYQGGLYPDGLNTPPASHHDAGILKSNSVTRLDPLGHPDPNGAIVMMSIGMSNASREFCSSDSMPPCDEDSFTGQAMAHPNVNPNGLAIANGAKGGATSANWDSPDKRNYDRVRDEVLLPMALTEAQVQAVWVKQARPRPHNSLPEQNADAFILLKELGDLARAVKVRYPNVQQMFLSSRIYAGYASEPLNPEPYAYESGFAVKWLIEAQIRQRDGGGIDPVAGDLSEVAAPWLGWSAYLWADGEKSRSDGLSWTCTDFGNDGTHPALPAVQKFGKLQLDFFLGSPYSQPWFTATGAPSKLGGTDIELVVPDAIDPGDELVITLTDQDLNKRARRIESDVVTVINENSGETEAVALEETGPNTGIFRGNLATLESAHSGVNNDAIISVQAGTKLSVTHYNAANSSDSTAKVTRYTLVNTSVTTPACDRVYSGRNRQTDCTGDKPRTRTRLTGRRQ